MKPYHRDIAIKKVMKDKLNGIKLKLTQINSKIQSETLSLNKDKINKIFTTLCLIMMRLLKNTTNSTLFKILSTTTTDCLNLNTITNGKPNPLFSHTSRETTPGTSMNTITQTGSNIRALLQKPTSKVLNSKIHTQLLRTHQEELNQRMNS